ncbi:Sulfite exporter TauE/SafE family protein 3 isoform B [Glycine soja]|uniref:Sulfite exporter TauE/SafE family protein 3 isoform B n=1 Tax=Glycine soja TaxID=3848 RepID=A0A445H5D1_GLYSO|nr:Sulfite exporter TauE/SafE family protein 3 isoform B [Glycine soja]
MRHVVIFSFNFLLLCVFISAITSTKSEVSSTNEEQSFSYHIKALEFIWKHLGYQHVWPEMEFSWRIVVGTLIGILGAAFGSVGGVGGGGIFVPMLILIIGFDPKSAVAISKCMVTGAAISAVFFCMKQRHPTLDEPVIDYDLMLLIQPTLMLGISIGVILSVIFADWMVTILLIILCIVTSIRAFFMGADTWKKETKMKEVNATNLQYLCDLTLEQQPIGNLRRLSSFQSLLLLAVRKKDTSIFQVVQMKGTKRILENLRLAYIGAVLFFTLSKSVIICHKGMQLSMQIPITVGFYLYQARALYQGRAAGSQHTHWPLHHLFLASICSLLAGIVGGLLGTGSGFVMGPLFLEVGIAPQVASATATFGMMYSSSLSVIQYYLLNRFPVPYALFLTLVAAIAAFLGQYLIDKLVNIFQRASLIIFVLAFTIFVSSIALGGVGISNMILKIQRNEYMGFDNFCRNDT